MLNPNFQNETFYHICNRGVDKRKVFMDSNDYARFLISMREFNRLEPIGSLYHHEKSKGRGPTPPAGGVGPLPPPLVDILCYCLNPNHFHLLLKQNNNGGISEFMKRLSGGYTGYFNFRHNRSGSLFQGKYKAFALKSEGKLWESSFYINGNAEIHGIDKCDKWPWSSCLEYLGLRKGSLCSKNVILKDFKLTNEYKNLLFDYIREKKIWKEEIKNMEF